MRPLLNIDLGELEQEPDELYALAHVANIACGGHAGDARSMLRALILCKRFGTRVCAHPSYPDRENFGRKPMALPLPELERSLVDQCEALLERANAVGVVVEGLKPHGALYHSANADPELARVVVASAWVLGPKAVIVGPEGGALEAAARAEGHPFRRERFADRGLAADGSLLPRGEPGAVIHDVAEARRRAEEEARSGKADTLCIHGDTPEALEIARAVRSALDALEPASP